MAKIKLSQKNEETLGADGYLVQYKFKNDFKDFRIGDCMFVKDLQSLGSLTRSTDDLDAPAFVFPNSKKFGEIRQAILSMGYDCVKQMWGPTAYLAKSIKVWALHDGAPLKAGVTYYILRDGTVATKAEYITYTNQILAEIEKKLGYAIDAKLF